MDALTWAHKDTHTLQHIEGSVMIKNTPRHSTYIVAKGAQSLRTPRQTYPHTHWQIIHEKKESQGQVPATVTNNTQADIDTTYLHAPIQATHLKERIHTYRAAASKGRDNPPFTAILIIRFKWGTQWGS